jgi:hypothetical protein
MFLVCHESSVRLAKTSEDIDVSHNIYLQLNLGRPPLSNMSVHKKSLYYCPHHLQLHPDYHSSISQTTAFGSQLQLYLWQTNDAFVSVFSVS